MSLISFPIGKNDKIYLTCPCFNSEHIDERAVCNAVAPNKDVDGFHVVNVGRMCLDQSTMLPATPWGVWEIIKRTGRTGLLCRTLCKNATLVN